MKRRTRLYGWSLLACLAGAVAPSRADEAGDAFFESKVRPILVARCLECHGETGKPKGGLRLSSRADVLKGGDTGPSAVAGDPAHSPILDAIRYVDEPKMPPKGKLPEAEINALERWVAIGLPWPDATPPPAHAAGPEYRITEEQRRFWSFQPIRATEPPSIKDESWPINPIDRFLLARLESAGLKPSAEADRATLVRRATFDLTGLPPTPDEISAFAADDRPDAFDRLVDRLLASPAYGQRWGRHWLDVARYADSRDARGVGGGDDIGEAWRYRDWVVDALNRDLPYDQFVMNQVAGDLLPGPVPGDINPSGMVATGLLTIGEWGTGDADKEKMLTDLVDDQVDVVTRGFLGLTVACARCHDHKFDPIPTADYYGLAGIFFSTRILPDPGAKTAGSPMLRTSLATRADREAVKVHARKMAEATAALESAKATARDAEARSLLPRLGEILKAGRSPNPPADLPAFAARNAANLLGPGDEGRPLTRPMADVQGRKGVHFWAGPADPPWIGVNTSAETVTFSTLTLPPRSVDLHPGPVAPAAIRWRSPFDGTVKVSARLADADPNCGNGVTWTVSVRKAGNRRELASGTLDNGGSSPLAPDLLARVEVRSGESIELAVGPRGDYSCDTTSFGFRVDRLGPEGGSWDLAADLMADPLASNPHADAQGHPGVWTLLELGPAAVARPLPSHPVWADWDASDKGDGAIETLIGRINADPALMEALLAEKGPLRPDPADLGSLPLASRSVIAGLQTEVDRLRAEAPPPAPLALVAVEGGVPRSGHEGFGDAKIHIRGDYRRLGPVAPRRVPRVVSAESPSIKSGSGRLELARWIASADNPLTARVMVNRVWQGHFGSGLARTPSNFGKLGEPPTHPDLLDWLAARFVAEGWSLKSMHRLMITSRAYRQSSTASADALRLDPDNRLWGRMNRKRLESEAVRDAMLAVAGRLDPRPIGPSTRDFNSPRRTLYQMTIRSDRSSFGPLFDAADSTAMVDRRVVSTVAPQALFLLNHPFALAQSRALADRLMASGPDDADRIAQAYLLLYGRNPTAEESMVGRDLLARFGEGNGPAQAWQAYAQVLLCANEFVYVD